MTEDAGCDVTRESNTPSVLLVLAMLLLGCGAGLLLGNWWLS